MPGTVHLSSEKTFVELSPEIREMIEKISSLQNPVDEDTPKIHIEATTGKAAFFYEKIRNTIGYQEEQMLRRLAITRIITRRTRFDKDEQAVISGLLWELIQSGYLKNDEIPQEKVPQLISCLKKYSVIDKKFPHKWCEYFFGILSNELEMILVPAKKEEIIIRTMHKIVLRNLFSEQVESRDYQKISDCLYYSLMQSYLKLDKAAIRFEALKYKIANWTDLNWQPTQDLKFEQIVDEIEDCLSFIPESKFPKISKRYYPLYIILQDITSNQPNRLEEILTSKQKLTIAINQITSQYFSQRIAKLNSSILKAILFILSTKIVLALIFEVPFDRYFHGAVNLQPLLINIIFPPLLMYISVSRVNVPGAENSKKIVDMAKRFIYNLSLDENEKKKYQYTMKRSGNLHFLLTIFYVLTVGFTIYGIIWLLKRLEFNVVSGFLFFFFLSAVSFLAFRIRKSATDIMVAGEKESAFAILLDFILLPFLKVGAWLSKKFEKANFVVLVFDFILEAPFKTILEAIEHWVAFMKEKKDEILS